MRLIVVLLVVVLAFSAVGLENVKHFGNLECYDDGHFKFSQRPVIRPVMVEGPDGEVFEAPGTWKRSVFTSEEAVLMERGPWVIRDPVNGDKNFTCPPFRFSCKLVNVNLDSCVIHGNTIEATFSLEHSPVSQMKFSMSRPGAVEGSVKTLFVHGTTKSRELENVHIIEEEGEFTLTAKGARDVYVFEATHPECVGKDYVKEEIVCAPPPEFEIDEDIPAVSCGHEMELEQRVRCRMGLRGLEEKEHKHFFPEECKKGGLACMLLQEDVADCWDESFSLDRDVCLRHNLKYDPELVCYDSGCRSLRNRQIFLWMKLQMDALVEQAEMLEEKELLLSEDLIQFAVFIEEMKVKFDMGRNRGMHQEVVRDVQAEWKELMEKVR